MNTITRSTNVDYLVYMNRDNLDSHRREERQVSREEEYKENNEEKNKQELQSFNELVAQEELSKEINAAVYFSYQNNQAMKSRVGSLLKVEKEEKDFVSDSNEFHKEKNRNMKIENYLQNTQPVNNDRKQTYEVWA